MQPVVALEALRSGDLESAGAKAARLGELIAAGFPVPAGFVVTTAAYRAAAAAAGLTVEVIQHTEDAAGPERAGDGESLGAECRRLLLGAAVPGDITAAVRDAYRELDPGLRAPVAVRSSATAEDLTEASFAGQLDSFLNVVGLEDVLLAVRQCWASLWTGRAVSYRAERGLGGADVALAVVVQQLVPADAAGVLFTADPATGRRDACAIAAAWGLGEAVVSGSVDPDHLVVSPAGGTGRAAQQPVVSARSTGVKRVRVVRAGRRVEQVPVPRRLRRRPVLNDAEAVELAGIGRRIEAHFGAPQDIEWARAGGRFVILQARPITVLPEETGPVPTDWRVPHPHSMYARASLVEQLPDPLTPLFADLIDASVARSLGALMSELIGVDVLRPGDIGMPTVNGYAYYEYSSQAMRRMMRMTPAAFRILLRRGEGGAVSRWRTRSLPDYRRAVAAAEAEPAADLDPGELLETVETLLDAGTTYYTAVQTLIPLAVTSELAFAHAYEVLGRRRHGDYPPPLTFLLGFDSEPILAEKSLWDLARQAAADPEVAALLLDRSAAELADLVTTGSSATAASDSWTAWQDRFRAHLARFGHAVYNLDFVHPVPADQPAPLIETVQFFLRGEGTDPYARQAEASVQRQRATRELLSRLGPLRRGLVARLLRWAQSMAPIREDALAAVGLGWPVARRLLAELGRRLVADGVVTDADDVHWLRRDELLTWTHRSPDQPAGASLAEEVERRRIQWRGRRLATPPQMLPVRAGGRLLWSRFLPANDADQQGDVLTGIGGSPGRVTGTARVIAGPAEFGLLQPGEILVTAITTPAWTTLFARAGGVVTDVGGPLSHSSIVAREYGIPAVLGTGVGTRRIRSGDRITVDGDHGRVILLPAVAG